MAFLAAKTDIYTFEPSGLSPTLHLAPELQLRPFTPSFLTQLSMLPVLLRRAQQYRCSRPEDGTGKRGTLPKPGANPNRVLMELNSFIPLGE